MTDQLEPIDPREAMEMYLDNITGTLSPNTVKAREYRLKFLIRWCEGEDNGSEPRLTNLNEISGRDLFRYKNWRKEGINRVTLQTQMSDVRQFMKFCTEIDAVPESIPDKVGVPVLEPSENVRSSYMDEVEASMIIEHVEKYQYASFDHALFLLLWQTGSRTSAMHSLDVTDIDWDNEQIEINHRPDKGTRLKNGEDGERIVTLPSSSISVLRDYVDDVRIEVTDDYDREPLFSTRNGRIHKNYLPKHIYYVTCPCHHGHECPSDRDVASCEHSSGYDPSVTCPHNTRPHDIRRGSITEWLRRDVPEKIVSDRMDVSEGTLDRHYDQRTEQERADQRREYLRDAMGE